MAETSPRRHRRSVRLAEYDYGAPGAYFVTIVTHQREHTFGNIVAGVMNLNEIGRIVHTCWYALPEHFPRVVLDAFVVMPNHVHGIIILREIEGLAPERRGAACCAPTANVPRRFGELGKDSLAIVVRSFKSAAARAINIARNTPGAPVWQRNYYEHIVRNDDDLNRIRNYIHLNPEQWAQDELYSAAR